MDAGRMYDLRSFSLDDVYRCSAELRRVGEGASDARDAEKRVVSYLYDELRASETRERECVLVRLFQTLPLSMAPPEAASSAVSAAGRELDPSTMCLSLQATRGTEPEWNDPALSRRHRLIPLLPGEVASQTPMVRALVAELGAPFELLSSPLPALEDPLPLFDVFHVEQARGSALVPAQEEFVDPHGVESVLGFGGVLPQAGLFVVIVFSRVTIPRYTAELFRTVAPSVGLALTRSANDPVSLEVRLRAYERIVRHHERIALRRHRELDRVAHELNRSLAERKLFEALVENSTDFIGISGPDGKPMYLNPAGRQMVGLSPTFDVTKTSVPDYYAGDDRRAVESVVLPAARAEGHWAGESTLRNWQTGAAIPVSEHHFSIREPGTARLLGLGTIVRDVSEKWRVEQEREQLLASAEQARAEAQIANRAKDEFLAVLGHELRNPLSPIVTAIELMKLHGQWSREHEVIERQADHLGRIVDDLLDIARIAQGKLEVLKSPVEVAAIVDRAVEMTRPLLDRRQQRLTATVPRSGLVVDADLQRLAQVVSNLLTNASKFSPAGSEVAIAAERRGAVVRLIVRDRGVGIPPEMQDAIFEAFVQHRRPGDASAGGLGLGLSVVRSLVALHGGTVQAHSEGPGKGSEFVVELPRLPSETEAAAADRPAPMPDASPQKTRVLLVEDNEDAGNLLADALAGLGYDVLFARDGPSALEAAAEFQPQVALLDIGLPAMDGYELARRLRSLPGLSAVTRLVAISGYGQESDRRRSVAAGFTAHLVKPITLDALTAVIRV